MAGVVPLVPPLVISDYDLPPYTPYFTDEFKKYMDDLDVPDTDLSDVQKTTGAVDLDATALTLDTPLKALDDGLAFEDTDTSAAAVDTIVSGSPLIEGGITANETNVDTITKAGNKINMTVPPIAGVGSGGTGGTPPAPAPKLPPIGGGIQGPPLAGAQAFITNLDRPGSPGRFRVGEPWQITIKAPAGSAIYVVASHDGVSIGQSPFGTVPASGVMLLHGTFTADQLGSWHENWYAGTRFISQIVFLVE